MLSSSPPAKRPAILTRACLLCKAKKTRCDGRKPQCTACRNVGKDCEYRLQVPRQRPTHSRIHELESTVASLEAFILTLHGASAEARENLLRSAVDERGNVSVPTPIESLALSPHRRQSLGQPQTQTNNATPAQQQDEEISISHFISLENGVGDGNSRSFGPSSALHVPTTTSALSLGKQNHAGHHDRERMRNALIANAAVQRQLEHRLGRLEAIEGVPTNIALQLLNCHWSRQHHTFLLTYRPAIMCDLLDSGPFASAFLINAIFACTSKFSGLIEVRDNPSDPSTAGQRFFTRCDKLLAQEGLLMKSTMPTIVGLLLLGSTYNARGETSKAWLYTGYALRMVYDLGLHLDPTETTDVPEEVEMRRRVFWGAFVCDKLQSLYMGRPVAIHVRDSRVSHELLDTYEEMELFAPANPVAGSGAVHPTPIFSVSAFQQLCILSKVMARIINTFYVVGATISNAQNSLQSVETALAEWKDNLPAQLDFRPWKAPLGTESQPPNVMVLHSLYHASIILLHRPFISDGHMRAAGVPARSWEQCSQASRRITRIVRSFRTAYTLASAPYVLGYTVYVACTIHVRNVASHRQHASLLAESVRFLDELCTANPGISKPVSIIRRMMKDNGLDDIGLGQQEQVDDPSPLDTTNATAMDDIINMFPTSDLYLINNDSVEPALYPDLSYDPLFGFMGGLPDAG